MGLWRGHLAASGPASSASPVATAAPACRGTSSPVAASPRAAAAASAVSSLVAGLSSLEAVTEALVAAAEVCAAPILVGSLVAASAGSCAGAPPVTSASTGRCVSRFLSLRLSAAAALLDRHHAVRQHLVHHRLGMNGVAAPDLGGDQTACAASWVHDSPVSHSRGEEEVFYIAA